MNVFKARCVRFATLVASHLLWTGSDVADWSVTHLYLPVDAYSAITRFALAFDLTHDIRHNPPEAGDTMDLVDVGRKLLELHDELRLISDAAMNETVTNGTMAMWVNEAAWMTRGIGVAIGLTSEDFSPDRTIRRRVTVHIDGFDVIVDATYESDDSQWWITVELIDEMFPRTLHETYVSTSMLDETMTELSDREYLRTLIVHPAPKWDDESEGYFPALTGRDGLFDNLHHGPGPECETCEGSGWVTGKVAATCDGKECAIGDHCPTCDGQGALTVPPHWHLIRTTIGSHLSTEGPYDSWQDGVRELVGLARQSDGLERDDLDDVIAKDFIGRRVDVDGFDEESLRTRKLTAIPVAVDIVFDDDKGTGYTIWLERCTQAECTTEDAIID